MFQLDRHNEVDAIASDTLYSYWGILKELQAISERYFSTPNIRGHIVPGTGIVFETYDDHVLLRARNFLTGTWLPQYDVTYPLY